MATERMQYCFNCGEELGVYKRYHGDEPECCGRRECMRELRNTIEAEREDRAQRASDDDYRRYD